MNKGTMLKVKYTEKHKNKQGVITHYAIQDLSGNTKIVPSNSLKEAIEAGMIEVTNLTLTSDNSLIDKKHQ